MSSNQYISSIYNKETFFKAIGRGVIAAIIYLLFDYLLFKSFSFTAYIFSFGYIILSSFGYTMAAKVCNPLIDRFKTTKLYRETLRESVGSRVVLPFTLFIITAMAGYCIALPATAFYIFKFVTVYSKQ